jgi:hypothetical protein
MAPALVSRVSTRFHHVRDIALRAAHPADPHRELNKYLGWPRLLLSEGFVSIEETSFLREFLRQHTEIRRVLEIGFNAGHSSDTFLSTRPDIEVTSFDIGTHAYSLRAKQFINQRFPGRHTFILGDSLEEIPKYIANGNTQPFDLILIDGGHTYDVAWGDLRNVRPLAIPGHTIVIMDDLTRWLPWGIGPTQVWCEALDSGLVANNFYLHNGARVDELPTCGGRKASGFGHYLS